MSSIIKRTVASKLKSTVMFVVSFALVMGSVSAAVPVFLAQTVSADSAVTIVTETNLNGWSSSAPYASTNSGATVGLVSDSTPGTLGNGALKIATNSLTAAKGQFVRGFSPIALSMVNGALGYSTKQNSASFSAGNASYQLQVYLNGTSGYTTLTYEPYISEGNGAVKNGVWQTWGVTNGRFYSSRTVAGVDGGVQGSQGAPTYSLAQIKAMFPSAIIYSYGVNVGSNNPSYDVEVDNFTFNDETYDFEPTPVVTAQDFATWSSSPSFKAINVGFKTDNFSNIEAVKVTLRKNGSDIVSNTASAAMLNAINTQPSGFTQNGQLSTPFIVSGVLNDTYCAGSPCWVAGSHNWLHSEKPDTAVITVTENGKDYTVTNTNLSEATATFDSLIAPDTTVPTINNPIITNNALWGSDYNILTKTKHLSETTFLPVIGGTVQVGATFNDDMLLTNIEALLPGRDFFVKDANWSGVSTGFHTVTWNTKDTSTWQGAPDGNYIFTFNAKDGGNGQNQSQNSATREILVTVDNAGPTVAFTGNTPNENKIVKGLITVEGNFTDANGLMNTDIGIHNDGRLGEGWKCHTDWQPEGIKTCTIDTTQLNDGTYQLTIAGKDKAGNVTQVFRTITIDNIAPSVNFISLTPEENAHVHGTITAHVQATDNIGIGSYYIRVWKDAFESGISNLVYNGCSNAPGATALGKSQDITCSVDTSSWDGTYVMSAQFLDGGSNWGKALRTIYVDNKPPVLTINTPKPVLSGEGVIFTGKVYEKTELLKLTVGGQDYTPTIVGNDWTYNLDTTKLDADTYDVKISAVDLAGNPSVDDADAATSLTVKPPYTADQPSVPTMPLAAVPTAAVTPDVNNTQAQQATSSNPDTLASVLGAQTTKEDASDPLDNTAALASTDKGWSIFGLMWYWWVLIAAAVASAWWITSAVIRRRGQDA